jgi:hypothetical protein
VTGTPAEVIRAQKSHRKSEHGLSPTNRKRASALPYRLR